MALTVSGPIGSWNAMSLINWIHAQDARQHVMNMLFYLNAWVKQTLKQSVDSFNLVFLNWKHIGLNVITFVGSYAPLKIDDRIILYDGCI